MARSDSQLCAQILRQQFYRRVCSDNRVSHGRGAVPLEEEIWFFFLVAVAIRLAGHHKAVFFIETSSCGVSIESPKPQALKAGLEFPQEPAAYAESLVLR